MFRLTALPASFGDCLWIEYGEEHSPSVILVDAGPSAPKSLKKRLEQLSARGGHLELVVVTHVDRDHIGGMLSLLEKNFYDVPVRDFWFNGFRHLSAKEAFGEKQGERLTGLLLEKGVPWNAAIKNSGFMVTQEACPTFEIPGGAKITLLSPDAEQLENLRASWVKVCGEADLYADVPAETEYFGKDGLEAFGAAAPLNVQMLASEAFSEDTTVANGSSIAFVIEYEGKRVLLGADAYPSRLIKSLIQTWGKPPFQFNLIKVPHHGSENNVSKEFIEALDCKQYLFSSNGASYHHPAQQAVARVIHYGTQPELLFNYRSAYSEIWDDQFLKAIHKYSTTYGNDEGISIII
ncbi:ComEC/Rec2 family competence protein [Pseudomonas sp. 22082]|uniref:ComEC/Rec2 family competence protein n=1 Tax=Pseudomonas sp. 22082 TaxID=3453868 RepID=UPI003F828706